MRIAQYNACSHSTIGLSRKTIEATNYPNDQGCDG